MNHIEINRAIKLLMEIEHIFENNRIYLADTPSLMARQLEDMLNREKTWEQFNAKSYLAYTDSLRKVFNDETITVISSAATLKYL